ncbi:class I SAM-dependent methyltransferase [Roseobacter litoralis]|uniref:class I SAM-dependent methyltransferase n=1 Tax=Roseobacter litoralis TaxID=42443 RepID=UPI0011D1E2A4|nr:class I SAM-dependent methyltransferase [Roseobacter litoralis]
MREIISVEHDTEWFGLASKAITALGEGQTQPTLKLCVPDPAEAPAYASGRQEYSAQSLETYVKAIDDFPTAYFDLVVVDGRARMACLRKSVERVAPGGVVLLDNSDYARYQAELERIWAEYQQTFERQDFLSPTPFAANIGSQITIFTRKAM